MISPQQLIKLQVRHSPYYSYYYDFVAKNCIFGLPATTKIRFSFPFYNLFQSG